MASRRRRRQWLALAGILIVVGAFVVVKTLVLNDDVHRVSRDEVLKRYRDESSTTNSVGSAPDSIASTTAAPVPLTLPQPGVYVYRTQGRESIDAVGGSLHLYPSETTITVIADGCGVMLRWDVLKERHERWRLCLGREGIDLAPDGAQSFHEFFGQTKVEDLTCDRDVVVVPLDARSRPKVALTCLLGDLAWQPNWEVPGRGTRTVGGTVVPVQRVRMTIVDDDQYFEHVVLDWYLDGHGLPVSATLAKESLSDTTFGDVTYTEQYSYDLVSLTPLR
ncbi:MAG: hypothetical protein WCK21_08530 [Actinomycetota bacterium]